MEVVRTWVYWFVNNCHKASLKQRRKCYLGSNFRHFSPWWAVSWLWTCSEAKQCGGKDTGNRGNHVMVAG